MAKVVVVTGASRGIGAAIARLAAKRGNLVAVNYARSRVEAEALCLELAGTGGKAVAIEADVSRSEGAAHLFREVERLLGPPDVLIANSGITGALTSIEDVEEEALEELFRTNVHSLFFCAREAVRRMSTNHGGRGGAIVVMSSTAARHGGRPGLVAYTASKGAADAFTLGLAKELSGTGIRVNALRPGVIKTSIHDIYGGDAAITAIAPTIPLQRVGTPEEIAEAALWLASESASYVHGALLDIGGGR